MIRKYIGNKEFYKKVLVITLPILVQQIITNFVSLIDNIMVGQIGTEQMSGVAIVNQLIFVFNVCIFGGISGAGIFTAQFFGKGDHKGVRSTFRAKVIIVLLMTALCIGLFLTLDDELISLYLHQGQDNLDLEATLMYGKEYMKIMLLQLPLFALTQAYAGTLRETGKTVPPMLGGMAAVVTNVVLDYALIFGIEALGIPAMGIRGAAVATVVSRFCEFTVVVLWTHFNKAKNKFIEGAYRSFRIPKELMGGILRKGFPLMINEVLWSTGQAVLTGCYATRGLEAVSALNISSTVSNLFFCAFFAFGSAISIIVGQLLGAGELERAKDEDRKLIFTTVVVCVIIGTAMAFLSPLFPQIYNTTDTVKRIATECLFISSVMMPFHGFIHTAYFTLRSGGKTVVTFLFDSVYVWVVLIVAAFTLSRFTNLDVVKMYAIVQSLDILKCVVGYILVKKGVWVNNLVEDKPAV
ncbi:MAG: MATE family efflux transporter [Ruminococcaceae bacterium]|nr:MATE family efflux transporter [Oscillospiraceae bacterium]